MKRSAEDSFDRFIATIQPRLNQVGPIKTKQVWAEYGSRFSYSYIVSNLPRVMELMIEQRKARKVSAGTWNILRPDVARDK